MQANLGGKPNLTKVVPQSMCTGHYIQERHNNDYDKKGNKYAPLYRAANDTV